MSRLASIIAATERPSSLELLRDDLHRLGVAEGSTLIVHPSLSRIGFVAGGAPAVVLALEEAVGAEGTVAMPTFTADLTDPATWTSPAIPADWHADVRRNLLPFDPRWTPTWEMGAIVDSFRSQPGTRRSSHPFSSWAARGPNADKVVRDHSLSMSSGERLPLARLYDLDADILLLGVGHERNSSLHLAEFRSRFAARKRCRRTCPARAPGGGTQWVEYDDVSLYDADFPEIGAAFERETGRCGRGRIGQAPAMMMPMRGLVDYAVRWMDNNRTLD